MSDRRQRLKLSTPAEVRKSLAKIANMVLNGELDPKSANAIVVACNAILGSIRLDDQENRLQELERIANRERKR